MFQIPQYVLENLKCAMCDGYLSIKPVMIKSDGEQVCGKCFTIIPTEDKEKCSREVGLETLAQLFLFPCRYSRHGCNYTFAWGNEHNHEEVCQYRYNIALPSTPRNSFGSKFYNIWPIIPKQELKHEFDDIKTLLSYEVKDSKYHQESRNLTYILKIQINYDKLLAVRNGASSETQNYINLSIEGAVSLKSKPELIYSGIKVNPAPEKHLHESLMDKALTQKYCSTCNVIVDDDVYTCTFGHVSCVNCRSIMCLTCLNQLEKNCKTICKNYHKGCKSIFKQSEVNKHQINCQYNDHRCPLDPCKFNSILLKLKVHLKQNHSEEVYVTNEITRVFQNKDITIVLLCYDSVFKCVYFYYKTFVEFFVTYMGPKEEAVEYTYELLAQSHGNSLATRRSKCSSWNDSMLERGITFEKKELVNIVNRNDKKLNFEIRLRILHIK